LRDAFPDLRPKLNPTRRILLRGYPRGFIVLLMTNTIHAARLENAIAYWNNCRGKGTTAQRAMVERTIAELAARLAALR
jgi:hypothetical protein